MFLQNSSVVKPGSRNLARPSVEPATKNSDRGSSVRQQKRILPSTLLCYLLKTHLCYIPDSISLSADDDDVDEVLKVFPYPATVTAAQFAVGTVLVILMWTSNIYKRPKITGAQLIAILPMAVVHTLGNLFTNMSLGKVSVSFTHTIKAMEPFFSVALSAMFLGELTHNVL
ncbi:hypothetical protein POM88_033171 [Heracleum sosnowskyi]|uniref:Sugar phosphate transporter domain-containing protein n=1 Tax=Heracleum sosnowskyi TaxID=360622 RepID=A0AAD8I326_9APIA|nr:hypothetical protein POM88_033171 [Heracleum sosnowskyi]